MAAPKGHPKWGGRKKGTPNKIRSDVTELFETLKYDPIEAVVQLLPMLDPPKQADVHLRLAEFKYPKRKAVEVTGENGGPVQMQAMAATDKERKEQTREQIEAAKAEQNG